MPTNIILGLLTMSVGKIIVMVVHHYLLHTLNLNTEIYNQEAQNIGCEDLLSTAHWVFCLD